MENKINVSIVLYNSDYNQIANLVNILSREKNIKNIYLIDNSEIKDLSYANLNAIYTFNGNNLGFGTGHNIAIKNSILENIEYHLVINSDILIYGNVIDSLIKYMDSNKGVGMIMPKIYNTDGTVQLLPKLLPTPLDLIIRINPGLGKIFSKRMKKYVLEEYQDQILNVPIISGCFSLFRTSVLNELGFYNEKYFMYFEDFDISRRIHKKYKTIYFPQVSITHFYERGASKSAKLFLFFLKSFCVYFTKYGWFIDEERQQFNLNVFNQIKLLK